MGLMIKGNTLGEWVCYLLYFRLSKGIWHADGWMSGRLAGQGYLQGAREVRKLQTDLHETVERMSSRRAARLARPDWQLQRDLCC